MVLPPGLITKWPRKRRVHGATARGVAHCSCGTCREGAPTEGTIPSGQEREFEMKRAIAMTAATLMGATMLAAPALAQVDTIEPQVEMNTGTGVDGGVEAETLPGGIDQGTTAASDGEASFDDALAAISGNAGSTASLGMVSEVNEVEIIRLSELDGYDEEMLDQ
jgi:hypothetical protein